MNERKLDRVPPRVYRAPSGPPRATLQPDEEVFETDWPLLGPLGGRGLEQPFIPGAVRFSEVRTEKWITNFLRAGCLLAWVAIGFSFGLAWDGVSIAKETPKLALHHPLSAK